MIAQSVVKNWYLVTLMLDEKTCYPQRVVYGTIAEDRLGRAPSGGWVCTTEVIRVKDGYAQTKNTLYRLIGDGKEIEIPAGAYNWMHRGHHPEDCLGMCDLEEMGYRIGES